MEDVCYAKTYEDGNIISDNEEDIFDYYECSYCDRKFDTLKGATLHENRYCKKRKSNSSECKTL